MWITENNEDIEKLVKYREKEYNIEKLTKPKLLLRNIYKIDNSQIRFITKKTHKLSIMGWREKM